MSQETSLANNAKVLDACQTKGGDCGNAITKAQQDRADLENYRDALTVQKNETADTASKTAIADQIRQADIQIRSADTVIADGKLIQADGDYSIAGLTEKERVAIGFALDPLGVAALRSGGKTIIGVSNVLDNIVYGKEQAAAVEKSKLRATSKKTTTCNMIFTENRDRFGLAVSGTGISSPRMEAPLPDPRKLLKFQSGSCWTGLELLMAPIFRLEILHMVHALFRLDLLLVHTINMK